MGIDVSKLSPWAQKQITEKLLAQEREKAARNKDSATPSRSDQNDKNGESKAGKYHNTPTERVTENGTVIKFQSQKEARRYDELMLMLKAGKIRELKLQPQFTLQESYVTPEGKRVQAIRYVADFSYELFCEAIIAPEGGGTWLHKVEDVKGGKATKTRVYQIKKKLMQERFGITIQEIDE